MGACYFASCLGRKRVKSMRNSEQYREDIERTFNAFYKIVLYCTALDTCKKIRRKQQFEGYLNDLREFDLEPVAPADGYFVKYDTLTVFAVRGKIVIVEGDQLATALLHLPKKRREVLFLRYYRLQRCRNRDDLRH